MEDGETRFYIEKPNRGHIIDNKYPIIEGHVTGNGEHDIDKTIVVERPLSFKLKWPEVCLYYFQEVNSSEGPARFVDKKTLEEISNKYK